MPVYSVTYDLVARSGESREYQPVWDAINRFENFQVLYSVFLVEAQSAIEIERVLAGALRTGDRYFIDRLRSGEYRYRAMTGINDWLLAHPPA